MPTAREIFLSHLQAYSDAVNHESVVSGAPSEHRKNARARIIRNGLAVVSFNILEDFLRRRAKEVLAHIGRAGIRFADLPDALKQMLTVKALNATAFQLRSLRPNRDEVAFAQEMAQQVASTMMLPFDACDVSFGYEGSNLTVIVVEDFLRALNVEKPWESIGIVAARAGIGTLRSGARAAFDGIARRRHEAAHDAQTDVQPSDLQSAHLDVLGIAFGFDAIASVAALEFRLLNRLVMSGKEKVQQKSVKMYFIDQRKDRRFGAKREGTARYHRCFNELQEAQALSREICLRTREICVIRSVQQIPTDWELVAL